MTGQEPCDKKVKPYVRLREKLEYTTARFKNGLEISRLSIRLSSIDEVTRTAECSLCGRVSLRKNGSKKWRCRNVVRENQERTIAAGQSRFYEYLAQQQCIDCGESDLIVLEFDHVQDDKSYNISDMVQKGYKWESVMKEIAKCEVVCANCHRRRTNIRGDWFRHAAR